MIFESLWPLAFLLAIPVVVILYLLGNRVLLEFKRGS